MEDGARRQKVKEECEAFQALWLAVIEQAFRDVQASPGRDRARYDCILTTSWFNRNDEDFIEVCTLAGCSPDKIIRMKERCIGGQDGHQ